MTFYDHYTKTGASVHVTWSPSRGADSYSISTTSLSTPPRQILSSFTTVDLVVEYNVHYTIDITANNCAGSNTTVLHVLLGETIILHCMMNIFLLIHAEVPQNDACMIMHECMKYVLANVIYIKSCSYSWM